MEILKEKQLDREVIVKKAVDCLSAGGLLIYPTETTYGVGVDATNQVAVDKLMRYKSRREGKPLSVAVADMAMASKYVEVNDIAKNLYDNYLPGPITVVSRGKHNLANGVESEYGTLGIRVPDYDLMLEISRAFNKPITATSANVSYQKRPYSIDDLLEGLPNKQKKLIDMIIDAGELPKNDPSTVVDTTLNNLNVMREGLMKFNEDVSDDTLLFQAKTSSAEETANFGSLVMLKHIDHVLDRPLVLALKGELGAGKTQFAKGIARNLHITDTISSPTYTIIDEYDYELGHRKGQLVHMDTWRVDGKEELLRTGIEKYMLMGNVVVIEWADKFYGDLLELVAKYGAKLLKVDFEYLSIDEREIKVYEEKT